MSISNGQLANQTSFNNAFISRTVDTSTIGKVDLKNTETESGAEVDNVQRELNSEASYTGKTTNAAKDAKPAWTHNEVGTGTDNLTERANALTERFNPSTGHKHNGADSPKVTATDLDNVRLRGYLIQGTTLSSITGSSVNVSAQLAGKVASTGTTVKGVVVSGGNNKIILRDATAANSGDQLKDSAGNIVYGKLAYAASVFTLSFYVDLAGTETAYSFTAANVAWFYQELFNPVTDAPVYNEFVSVPSDNATQDVVDATATQRGLVSTAAQSMAGVKTFTDTTQSTSKDLGAVVVEGGLGVEKNINAGGNITATGTMGASNLSGTNTGDVTLSATGSTPNANGASLAGQVLTLQPANATNPGIVSTAAQSMAGVKTLTDTTQSTDKDTGALVVEGGMGVEKNINAGGNIAATGTVGGSNLSGTNTGDITLGAAGSTPNANGASLVSQVLTLQPANATNPGLVSTIAQTLAGLKTFANGVISSAYLALVKLDVASAATITQLSSSTSFVKLTGSTATTIQGIAAGTSGQVMTIHNGSSADCTIAHQNATAAAADRFKLPGAANLTIVADSSAEFIYDVGQSRWVIKSGSGSGTASAAGGGVALRLIPKATNAATEDVDDNNVRVFSFGATLTQAVLCWVKVPTGYVSGKPITILLPVYSNDATTATAVFKLISSLVHTGTSQLNSTTNQKTTTGTINTGAAKVNVPQVASVLVTDSAGAINGVSVQAGDLIPVEISLDSSSTSTVDAYVLADLCEVTFQ